MGDISFPGGRGGGDLLHPASAAGALRFSHREFNIVAEQYGRAADVLRRCAHAAGLNASGASCGHHQVWARDSMIALLGASTLKDKVIGNALAATVATLRRHQTAAGAIPNNVDSATGEANFRAYADSGLWFVIGSSLLAPDWEAIRRVLAWYDCHDVDQSGLLSMQEASDWQDLFPTRGKGLSVNCLYVIALGKAAMIARSRGDRTSAEAFENRALAVRRKINERFWYCGDGRVLRHISHSFSTANQEFDSLGRRRFVPQKRILADESYYLPYLGFREIGEWFDALGNLLCILAGVADARQARAILGFIERHGMARRPLQAIYPVVDPSDPDWRDYFGDLNQPHCYHNGGVWPFLGGFYIAALVATGDHAAAHDALDRLALLNREGSFNEWHHGVSGEPLGVAGQAWSAGMFIYACECVARGRALFFDGATPGGPLPNA